MREQRDGRRVQMPRAGGTVVGARARTRTDQGIVAIRTVRDEREKHPIFPIPMTIINGIGGGRY